MVCRHVERGLVHTFDVSETTTHAASLTCEEGLPPICARRAGIIHLSVSILDAELASTSDEGVGFHL